MILGAFLSSSAGGCKSYDFYWETTDSMQDQLPNSLEENVNLERLSSLHRIKHDHDDYHPYWSTLCCQTDHRSRK
jgi:hypothetical protein